VIRVNGDRGPRIRTFRFPPRTVKGWVGLVLFVAAALALAFVGIIVLVIALPILFLASLFMKPRPPRPPEPPPRDRDEPAPGGRVIDVEYEIDDEDGGPSRGSRGE